MRSIYKILTSLIISLVLVSGLGYFAFTGAFSRIETQFFSQRVIESQKDRQARNNQLVELYHRENMEQLQSLSGPQLSSECL